ncbi:MAG: extracellular solute-binding protein [Caldilineaceae bacterium]|nr:extracellular solute-binding protein [Caldilineaceae bacterium]
MHTNSPLRSSALSRRSFLRGAAASAALVLAACAAPAGAPAPGSSESGSPSEEPIVLRLHMRAGSETSEPSIYVQRPAEFTEETGVQVQLEPIPSEEYWAKIETLAASNTLGDNMFTDEKNWQHSRAVHFGLLQEIDDFMASENVSRDEWLPGVFATCIVNGKVYGLPKTGHPAHAFLFINNDMLEEAGIEVPTDGSTTSWEQYREWANLLATGEPDARDVYGFHMPTNNIQMIINSIRTFGGWELTEDGTQSPVMDDGWKGSIGFAHALYQEDKTMPLAANIGTGGVVGLFASSRLPLMATARSTYSQVLEAVGPEDGSTGGFRWSYIGLAMGPNFNGWGASLNTHAGTTQSQHKLESFKLTYALSDARFAYLTAHDIGFLVGRANELDEIGDAADNAFIQLQFQEYSKGVPYRIGANYRGLEWEQIIRNTTDLVYLGERQPDDAFFAELETALNDLLARPV